MLAKTRERSRTALKAPKRVMGKHRRLIKRLDAPHVRLYRWMLDSPAYLSLGCPARAVLVEIGRVYDGMNNGRLGMSVRMLAERCHIARGTVRHALGELQDRGFIECVTRGSFSQKGGPASEWRLTWWRCDVNDAPPEKPFMKWRPEKQNTGSKYPVTGSNQDHPAAQNEP
jgi:hypothetical protein